MSTRSRAGSPTLQSLQNLQLAWVCPILKHLRVKVREQLLTRQWNFILRVHEEVCRNKLAPVWGVARICSQPFWQLTVALLVRTTFPRLFLWIRSFCTPPHPISWPFMPWLYQLPSFSTPTCIVLLAIFQWDLSEVSVEVSLLLLFLGL